MIKKYEEFINESTSKNASKIINFYINNKNIGKIELIKKRNEFADCVISLSKFFNSYYSSLACSDESPDDDYKDMQKLMDRSGWTIESIKLLFSEEVNKIVGEINSIENIIESNSLDIMNGYIDLYLYKTMTLIGGVPNYISLGGGWATDLEVLDPDEFKIRWEYGHHLTKYGKLYLDQIGLTTEEFRILAIKEIGGSIIDLISAELYKNKVTFDNELIEEYIVRDNDRMHIYINDMIDELLGNENYNIFDEPLEKLCKLYSIKFYKFRNEIIIDSDIDNTFEKFK